jgi:predicted nucleic acid-binding protein
VGGGSAEAVARPQSRWRVLHGSAAPGEGARCREWALRLPDVAAPSLVIFESANIIRRHELAGHVSPDQAAQAHADMLDLAIEQWPYELLAMRARALRRHLSSYDASYVAVAELTGSTLVTLDRRIGRAPDLRCIVATP